MYSLDHHERFERNSYKLSDSGANSDCKRVARKSFSLYFTGKFHLHFNFFNS